MSQFRKRLGDILLEAKVLTPNQLSEALEVQKRSGGRLGEVLVELGYLSEVDLAQKLAEQLGLPFFRLSEVRIEPGAVRILAEQAARRYRALPLGEKNGVLTVALADPLNIFAIDDLSLITGKKIAAAVMTEREIEKGIEQAYRLKTLEEAAVDRRETAATPQVEEAPVVQLVNSILDRAIEERATDIHIEPLEDSLRVRYRIDGLLYEVMAPPKSIQAATVSRIKIMAAMDISEHRAPQDGRFQIRRPERGIDVDLRVSTLPTIFGEKVVIRILDRARSNINLEQLGFLPDTIAAYRQAISRPFGMVLVTGPTGSGKTTTLTATLRELNKTTQNIITIEDPVEYQIAGVNQVQVNPKAGVTFASGLRSILRQDPNIIMIGEIRDGETAEIAVRSALTGHLVFSTLHTNDAPGALTRLADMGIEPFLIASSVLGVLAQRLARRLCPRCKEPHELAPDDPERKLLPLPPGPVIVYRAVGCNACNGTGYRGQVGIFEWLRVSSEIRDLIAATVSAEAVRRLAHGQGMRSLVEDGVAKVLEGTTTPDEIRRVAYSGEA